MPVNLNLENGKEEEERTESCTTPNLAPRTSASHPKTFTKFISFITGESVSRHYAKA